VSVSLEKPNFTSLTYLCPKGVTRQAKAINNINNNGMNHASDTYALFIPESHLRLPLIKTTIIIRDRRSICRVIFNGVQFYSSIVCVHWTTLAWATLILTNNGATSIKIYPKKLHISEYWPHLMKNKLLYCPNWITWSAKCLLGM